VPLVDRAQDAELLKRVKAIRKRFAQDVGFLPPPVHIRDNLELRPGAYRITLRGVPVGEGELQPGHFLAINPGRAIGTLAGAPTRDPAFGLPATWIDGAAREGAQQQGFTVVDCASVAATHFSHVLQAHAARLLGRQETQGLIDHLAKTSPKLVEDLVPKLLTLSTVQRVLQNLLEDGIPVRDLRTILETLAEYAPRTQEAGELTALVRVALGPAIVQHVFGAAPEIGVLVLEPDLERVLLQSSASAESALEPGLADGIARQAAEAASRREALGEPAALVVPDRLRPTLARLLKRAAPHLKVLGHAEIPDSKTLRVHAVIGARP
jgi:flagellar biosynthesis protein FlhA